MRHHRIVSTALSASVACALLAGCTPAQEPRVAQPPAETSSVEPSAPATEPARPGPQGVPLGNLEIELRPFLDNLDSPLYITGADDGSGRLFVVEQGGTIHVVRNAEVRSDPYLDISDRIVAGGERGLLGLAFSNDFEDNGRFYVNYTRAGDGATVVARFTADDPSSDSPKISGPRVVITIPQPYANHNGGCLQMDPRIAERDLLFVGMGDGGSAGDPQNRAQNPSELLGKLLRIDVSGSSAGRAYSIPEDNPYAREPRKGAGRPEVFALGLRNPWRFSFDTVGGTGLWIGDVGQNAWEEIDFVDLDDARERPLNFGWRKYEGDHAFDPQDPPASRVGLTFPVAEYGRGEGGSVTGGYVYRGTESPALYGTYLYGDYLSGNLWGVRRNSDGSISNRRLLGTDLSIASFGAGENRELYICDLGGSVYRIIGRER
ncbi:MAG: PQQ-dependent sugar dehydrogenase [Coriobacteriales bacterium]|nr:PQQ-dependent sugar dehydrogenase [Coriobacteriales bacterium]